MRPLAASDILKVWEQGEAQSAIERALTMLAEACPEVPRAELASLSVQQRDAQLFELRELTFGPQLAGFTTCPQCQERLEFTLNITALGYHSAAASTGNEFECETDEYTWRFRLPNSHDLAAAAGCVDVTTARRLLVERCVLQVRCGGDVIAGIADEAITQFAERLGEYAPAAEVCLAFVCPACGHQWRAFFDIAAFFWVEIVAQARRLLREVHLLASAYGWREADVLALSARRRQAYLEMIGRWQTSSPD
jgi:hypothetical protein